MFKRLLWLTIGIVVGFGASFWLMRFVRETLARLAPERVSRDLAGIARRAGEEVRASLRAGREAMAAREAELRDELGPPARR